MATLRALFRLRTVVVMDKVAVVENNGVETSQLHLFTVDIKGAITKEQAKRRLNGLVTSPPLTTGRGLIVVTDRGQIEVYDIAAGNGGEASPPWRRDPTSSQPITRYFAVIGRSIWLADTQLTKYNIVPTGSRLPVEEIENNHSGATFNHPLQAIGETLIEVYRPKGRAGVVVAALDSKQGHVLWATDLAMPPAGAPVVDDAARTLTVANSAGYAFRFDEATIRSRVQDQPLATPLAPPQPPMLDASLNLGQGRAAFYAAGSDWLLLYNPADSASAKWLQLVSPLACGLTQLGNGFLAPLKVGQVFYLNAADGARLATPFQPRISTQSSLSYKPAGDIGADGRQFVITDGAKKSIWCRSSINRNHISKRSKRVISDRARSARPWSCSVIRRSRSREIRGSYGSKCLRLSRPENPTCRLRRNGARFRPETRCCWRPWTKSFWR